MKTKTVSMIIIFCLYVVALAIGIFSFLLMNLDSVILKLFIANVFSTVFIFLIGLLLKNASLYDPYWSIQPPVIYALMLLYFKAELTLTHFLVFVGLFIWSVRLTYNWAKNWHGFKEQDWRYTLIRNRAPKLYVISNLFGIHLMPTTIVYIQLISVILVINQPMTHTIVSMIGLMIMIGAALIQWFSDDQMAKFKEKNKGEKKCINEGLWRFSRHPNYFGEIAMWWGLYIMYVGISNQLDYYIIAPALMTLLFLFISIPMMEKKILTTRPEYKVYQESVSMLFPLPPKTNHNIEENA